MSPTELAKIYMQSFFGEKPLEEMRSVLADDLKFTGPFYKYATADEYILSLIDNNMSADVMSYELLQEHESKNTCCLVYRAKNHEVNDIMAQLFEVNENKIIRIRLLLNASKLLKK